MSFQKSINAKKPNKNGLDDPNFERDPVILLQRYIKAGFISDFFANIPILIFDISTGLKNG